MPYSKKNKLHIVAVTAAVRREDGRYLVLKRSECESVGAGKYCMPGGKVEDNQTVDEALAEEIMEEAGLKMKQGKILLKDKSFVRPDKQTVKIFSYLCEVDNSDQVKIDEDDFSNYKWVNLEELKDLDRLDIDSELERAEEVIRSGADLNLLRTISQKYD